MAGEAAARFMTLALSWATFSSEFATTLLEPDALASGTVAALSKGARRLTSSKNSAAPSNPCAAPAAWYCARSVVRSRSVSSKDRPKLISLMMLSESTGAQGRNVVISSAAYSGGNGWRAT